MNELIIKMSNTLAICIPVRKVVFTSFVLSLLERINELNNKGYKIDLIIESSVPLDKARNIMVEKALKKNPEKIIFWDSDVVVGDNVIPALFEDKDPISSALYVSTDFGIPVVRVRDGITNELKTPTAEEISKLKYADGVGMGCVAIHRKVFEKVPKPWFIDDWRNPNGLSEDLYFCEKARKHGFKIRFHPELKVGHVGAVI